MPRLPPEPDPLLDPDPKTELDSNGTGTPNLEVRFETYAFMGINKTKLLPDQPDWIVKFLFPGSFSNSEGSVRSWHKYNCPEQAGSVVRCNVVAIELSKVQPIVPTTAPTRLAGGGKQPKG